ncbi:MAG TPA: transglutaminase domain-containing protein [Glycomyces sp.]|nr:transglutaminase domain-containing protein [Glycomyces sp.]
MSANDLLTYYTEPGPLSAAGPHETALKAVPGDVPGLLAAVQGVLVHQELAHVYGFAMPEARRETAHFRATEAILGRILDEDPRSLAEAREPAHKIACTCRTFSLIAVSALRAHGIPARARCGFGNYFEPGWHIDHWVAEYWDAERGAWILGDAQMDPILVEALKLEFDPADVPRDRFVVAGQAWTAYRTGELDPDKCGLTVPGEQGAWWIAANLVRDVAALAKMELLPWDVWGGIPEPEDEIDEVLTALFDELAAITADPDTAAEARTRYETDERIRVPAQVRNAVRKSTEPVIGVD